MAERFFVTGADGCLGAWVVRALVDEGARVTAFDVGAHDHRHRLVSGGRPPGFERVVGDITDPGAVRDAMAGTDRVIHLAALQVPLCRADPSRGAAVNVAGTVNVFEAAAAHRIEPVVYASSIAVYGAADDYPQPMLGPGAPRLPRTLYGVFKVANEQTAAVYASDHGLSSIGLRPHTLYGPGRDQGITSQPTAAIDHAVRAAPYRVDYDAVLDFQYAPDIAALFVAAARAEPAAARHAPVLNPRGHVVSVAHFLDRVKAITGYRDITTGDQRLPLPHAASPHGLTDIVGPAPTTPLDDAITATAQILAHNPPTPHQHPPP